MRIRSDDVARLAGVSRSAVSRAFTPGASIAAETRGRIIAAAKALGYRPNLIARGLTGRATGLVAVVMGTVARPYEAMLLEKLGAAIRSRGLWPLLIHAVDSREIEDDLEQVLAYQVSGAIVATGSVSRSLAERCTRAGAPLVLVGRRIEGAEVDSVCCDNRAGMALLVELLVASGRTRVAWIGGHEDTFSNAERWQGLVSALGERGLAPVAALRGDFSVESGLAQALALLTQRELPHAVVCANDAMALGATMAAGRLGLGVPDAVAVTGFDNIAVAGWDSFRLTTIDNPVDATASEAVRLLLRRIKQKDAPVENVQIRPELVRRSSA